MNNINILYSLGNFFNSMADTFVHTNDSLEIMSAEITDLRTQIHDLLHENIALKEKLEEHRESDKRLALEISDILLTYNS